MKKTLSALLTLTLVGAMALPSRAVNAAREEPGLISTAGEQTSGRYTVQVNGKDAQVNATVMVPLRAIAETLGFTVIWDNDSVLVDNKVMHATVTLGVDSYMVATSVEGVLGTSAPFSLGAAPCATDGVTYVPLTLFEALLGNVEGMVRLDGDQIVINTNAGSNSTELPDPFAEDKTLAEAAKAAGFELTAPVAEDAVIRVIPEELIEVIDYAGEEETGRIRKGVGSEDVSGDYSVYAQVSTVDVDGLTVTMKGDGGKERLAIWTCDGCTFSVSVTNGVTRNEMSALVKTVK